MSIFVADTRHSSNAKHRCQLEGIAPSAASHLDALASEGHDLGTLHAWLDLYFQQGEYSRENQFGVDEKVDSL